MLLIAKKQYMHYYDFMFQVSLPSCLHNVKIHMVGIKGTGMTALTELLAARGAIITGSDISDEFYTDAILEKLNIKVKSPFSVSNLPQDIALVIHSAAYLPETNEELKAAEERNIPILPYPKALGLLSENSYSCGICGVHGKTTTTGIAGTILKMLNLNSCTLAGSLIPSFGNSCTVNNGSKYFVAETCEYKKHFLNFCPKKIVLTSLESDHQDFYPTYESILAAFLQYIDELPNYSEVIYCADDKGACEAVSLSFCNRPDLVYIPYGESAMGDYKISIKGIQDERLFFSLAGFGGEFNIPVPGNHNVLNAAAAIALSVSLLKEEFNEIRLEHLNLIRKAVASYTGAKRRYEILGTVKNILFIDDYAHHPTAIKMLLKGLKEFYPNRRIIADFMPHTYSRTAALLDSFAECFTDADIVILHKIYASAREKYTGKISSAILFEKIKKKHKQIYFFPEPDEAQTFVLELLKDNDLFITIGAGNNWEFGKKIFNKMQKDL